MRPLVRGAALGVHAVADLRLPALAVDRGKDTAMDLVVQLAQQVRQGTEHFNARAHGFDLGLRGCEAHGGLLARFPCHGRAVK